jgi:predicted lipoprotein with Yx(FWY)xxD motif
VIKIYASIATLALSGALLVTGCGSSGNSYGSNGESTTAAPSNSETSGGRYSETSGYGQSSSSPSSGSGGAVAVASVGDLGKVLVDSEGFTLYYFEKDKGGKSACYGACASAWPPLTTGGAPHATSGAEASKLSTAKRTDGTVQVTYAGWPLYTYTADAKPGEDNGTDVDSFGGVWYPLHPNGEQAGD